MRRFNLNRGYPPSRLDGSSNRIGPCVPESLEEPVQENLGLPLFVPLDVRPNPRDKTRQPLPSLGFDCVILNFQLSRDVASSLPVRDFSSMANSQILELGACIKVIGTAPLKKTLQIASLIYCFT